MTFRCDVGAEQLEENSCGHFCHQCQKEVIDFRHYSMDEIHRYAQRNGEACGTFSAKQADPDYLAPIAPRKHLRSLALLSGMFVFSGGATGFAQTTIDPKKEQSQGTSNAPNFTTEEAEEAQSNGTPISMSVGETDAAMVEQNPNASPTRKVKPRRYLRMRNNRYYLSKKFPFVKRDRLWRGKFKM